MILKIKITKLGNETNIHFPKLNNIEWTNDGQSLLSVQEYIVKKVHEHDLKFMRRSLLLICKRKKERKCNAIKQLYVHGIYNTT